MENRSSDIFLNINQGRALRPPEKIQGVLPEQESFCAPKATFFDKSTAHSRRFQNSPFGLRQLKSYARFPQESGLPFRSSPRFIRKKRSISAQKDSWPGNMHLSKVWHFNDRDITAILMGK